MDAYTSNPALFANADLFKRFQGRRVRTVVKVVQLDGMTLRAQSCDGQNITIRQVIRSEEFTPFVEFIGVVDGDLSMRFEKSTNFGDNFDMAMFNNLCVLANGAHQEIFI